MPSNTKEGRRNNAGDLATIQSIHDAACSLGAGCAEVKAVSLDERLSAIRSAIYSKIRATANTEEERWDTHVAWVYDGYAIVESRDNRWLKITFTEDSSGTVVVSERDTWQEVEKEWVVKSIQGEFFPGLTETVTSPVSLEIKAVNADANDGRIGGYLIVYGTPTQTDITAFADFFTKSTDFCVEDGAKTPVWYHHGQDSTLKRKKLGSGGTLTFDDVGVWIDAQLDMRDKYEAALYKAVKDRKMGWSSGTAAHLVERKSVDGANEITLWPLGLDASLTPTPAEPRALATAASTKSATAEAGSQASSAQDAGNASQAAASSQADASNNNLNQDEGDDMPVTADEFKSLLQEALEERLSAIPGLTVVSGGVDTKSANVGDNLPDQSVTNFKSYLRTGATQGLLKVGDDGSIKALGEQSAAAGAVLVPKELYRVLIERMSEDSVLRAAGATVIQKTGTNSFTMARLAAGSGAISQVAEHGTITEEDPTLESVEFKPYKYPKITKVSDELLQDSGIDVENKVILRHASRRLAQTENVLFATGTGSGQPEGVVTGATLGATAASATVVTYADLSKLFFSVAAQYRQNGSWMVGDTVLAAMDSMTVGSAKALTVGPDGRLAFLGRPVFQLSTLATPATTAKVALFGDFSWYWIVEFGGVDVKRLNEKYADTGDVGFRWQQRIDGHVIDPSAIKYLQMA